MTFIHFLLRETNNNFGFRRLTYHFVWPTSEKWVEEVTRTDQTPSTYTLLWPPILGRCPHANLGNLSKYMVWGFHVFWKKGKWHGLKHSVLLIFKILSENFKEKNKCTIMGN